MKQKPNIEKQRTTVYLPTEDHKDLKIKSTIVKKSMGDLISDWIRSWKNKPV